MSGSTGDKRSAWATLDRISPGWAALAVLLLGVALALFHLLDAEPRLSGTNSVPTSSFVLVLDAKAPQACADNQPIPRGTTGVSSPLLGTFGEQGKRLDVTVKRKDGTTIAKGFAAGFDDGAGPIVELPALARGHADATVCFAAAAGRVALAGEADAASDRRSATLVGKQGVPVDIAIRYWKPGEKTVLGMAGTIFDRAALFRPGWVGAWTFPLLIMLACLSALIAVWLLLRSEAGRTSARRWALIVAGLAFANAALWGALTPTFQTPDEYAHYWYVEHVAHLGNEADDPAKNGLAATATHRSQLAFGYVAERILQRKLSKPSWSNARYNEWRAQDRSLAAQGDVGRGPKSWAAYSPLYYAPAAVPYKLAGNSDPFTKVWLVRLFSALLVAIAAAFGYLAARELVPDVAWFASAAGLAVAFEPMVAHMGGAVNNDSLLIATSCLIFYLLARAWRRGLGKWSAVGIGVASAAAVITKPTVVGIMPAVLLGVALLAWRDRPDLRSRAIQVGAYVGTISLLVLIPQLLFNWTSNTSDAVSTQADAGQLAPGGLLSYTWQFYLPKLPFMQTFFGGTPPVGRVFLGGFVGDFNSLDTQLSSWLYAAALAFGALLAGGLVWRLRERDFRQRWVGVIAVAALAVVSLCLLINAISYVMHVTSNSPFAQGRYLLALIAIFGVFVAGGALSFGRRRGFAIAVAAVTGLAVLNVFGMWLSLERFYL